MVVFHASTAFFFFFLENMLTLFVPEVLVISKRDVSIGLA